MVNCSLQTTSTDWHTGWVMGVACTPVPNNLFLAWVVTPGGEYTVNRWVRGCATGTQKPFIPNTRPILVSFGNPILD